MTQVPIVSVIMPVYNGGTYLHTAIQSILHQKFSDFEFIIINDGSSDNSLEIIESFEDKRIKCISFEQNQGIVAALNKGVESSKGKYIARMDADDISHPERLGKQVDFLEKRTEIGIVGTGAFIFSINKNNKIKGHSYPLALLENIPIKLLFTTPFAHPTIMVRASVLQNFPYKKGYPLAEDYKLWTDILEEETGANIDEILYFYRKHSDNSSSQRAKQKKGIQLVQKELFQKIGVSFSEKESECHYSLSTGFDVGCSNKEIKKYVRYISNKKIINPKLFNRYLFLSFIRYAVNNKSLGLLFSPIFFSLFSFREIIKFISSFILDRTKQKEFHVFIHYSQTTTES